MADRKISDLTALTAPASGDYLPIVDISEAAAANKNKRITIEELFRGVPLGTAAAPSIAIEGDEDTGVYSPGANQLAISTGGSGRLFVDATGGVQIDKTGAGGAKITSTVQSTVYFSNAANTGGYIIGRSIGSDNAHNLFSYDATNSHYVDYFEGGSGGYRSFYTNGTERLRITSTGQLSHIGAGSPGTPAVSFSGSAPVNSLVVDSSGRCGVGTSAPQQALSISGAVQRNAVTLGTSGSPSEETGYIYKYEGASGTQAGIYFLNSHNSNNATWLSLKTTSSANVTSTALTIDSSQRVGIGTSSPGYNLDLQTASTSLTHNLKVNASAAAGNYAEIAFQLWQGAGSGPNTFEGSGTSRPGVVIRAIDTIGDASGDLVIGTFTGGATNAALTEKLRLKADGKLGIGVTAPQGRVDISKTGASTTPNLVLVSGGVGDPSTVDPSIQFGASGLESVGTTKILSTGAYNARALAFHTGADGAGTEKARLTSSGQLLVGTSTARANFFNTTFSPQLQVEGTGTGDRIISLVSSASAGSSGPTFALGKQNSGTIGGNTIVANDDNLGTLSYLGSDGTEFVEGARIAAFVDGTPGANDMPGRLVFSTTADGASSPTERIRITSDGSISTKTVPTSLSAVGTTIFGASSVAPNAVNITRSSGYVLAINRTTDDGNLVEFYQDTTIEGTISVSGTTVSYNGAHLSRWSQLPSGQEREEILRGTVLSNIDEMCEWDEEDNEQLNRMKVSDVEGDKNVSGVFQAWDDDDDTYTNDFYCAMTGDFIIRIAQGVTVERGDLLMSAGDGTAKPQDDDIIRSKTIAKVTSTNMSCTYDDGSYCVPCVLMAC